MAKAEADRGKSRRRDNAPARHDADPDTCADRRVCGWCRRRYARRHVVYDISMQEHGTACVYLRLPTTMKDGCSSRRAQRIWRHPATRWAREHDAQYAHRRSLPRWAMFARSHPGLEQASRMTQCRGRPRAAQARPAEPARRCCDPSPSDEETASAPVLPSKRSKDTRHRACLFQACPPAVTGTAFQRAGPDDHRGISVAFRRMNCRPTLMRPAYVLVPSFRYDTPSPEAGIPRASSSAEPAGEAGSPVAGWRGICRHAGVRAISDARTHRSGRQNNMRRSPSAIPVGLASGQAGS